MEIITNMSNQDYHANPAIGSSKLKMLECPARYKYQIENGAVVSEALRFGSVFHSFVEAKPIHILGINCPRRSNANKSEWADFFTSHGADGESIIDLPAAEWNDEFQLQTGKIISSPKQIEQIALMVGSIMSNRDAVEVLTGGVHEASLFWTDNETCINLKARPDHYVNQSCGELKSARDASERGFTRAIINYGYHISQAMYLDGFKQVTGTEKTFRFVVVEKDPPYLCATYELDGVSASLGEQRYRELLRKLHDCLANDQWPGYENNHSLELPMWAFDDEPEVEVEL